MVESLVPTLAVVALKFMNIPYVWGGNTPEEGFDCSGLVAECLRSVGKLDSSDYSAQMLFNKFSATANTSTVQRDAVLFFGRDIDHVSHVAISLGQDKMGEAYMIEAGGEGRPKIDSNGNEIPNTRGYVRIRPVSNRTDFLTGIIID